MADNIEIPEGWMETTLGEVIEIQSGKSRPKETGIFPVYGGNGILDYANNFNIEKPSIIVGRVGAYCGCVYFERSKFWLSDNALGIHNNKKSEIKFLYYFLINQNLNKKAIGGAQPLITQGILNGVEITIPLVPEQEAIAGMLSSFDDKIELLGEQNETLEKTAQTIFQEWFGKYSIDDELPEGWRMGRMIEFLGEFESGRRPKGGVSEIKSGIPSIGAEYVKGLITSNFSNVKLIPKDFFNEMKTGKIKDNDILVYKDGGAPGEFKPNFTLIGEGYPFEIGAINEHVFRIQTIKNWQQYFLYFWLNGRVCIGELKSIGGKAAIPGINGTDFKNLTLLIPNEESLVKFHFLIQPIMKKILKNNLHIQFLSKTRDELLPRLMNGEIRV